VACCSTFVSNRDCNLIHLEKKNINT
jgi:hypothetical protein